MAAHPEFDDAPETEPEPDGDGLTRRERRLAGKQAKSTVKIPTRGQYPISANHRQYSHRRRG